MKYIALEEHVLPDEFWEEVGNTATAEFGVSHARGVLDDVHGDRVRLMDEAGIAMQVLSVVTPGAQHASPAEAGPLAERLNDRVAKLVEQDPSRFQALASLPTPDPLAAADEAYRAVRELGMRGFVINGHTQGKFLDDPSFDPMLAAIEELDVPIYLHPTYPPEAVFREYFGGLDPAMAATLSTGGWGWHAETGLHILRMVVGGVFDRHPGLQMVVGHMGENLPFSLMRADNELGRFRAGLAGVADTVRSHVNVTICGYTTLPPFRCALEVFGPERVLFSVDYPFGDCKKHVDFLESAPISDADRELIAHGNAARLFGL